MKVVAVVPGNRARRLPAIHGTYLLLDAVTGQMRAILDGGELTARRTAAASALAARYLSRPDATRLLIVGTGRLSRLVAEAHAAVRPIREIAVWGRSEEKAAEAAQDIGNATGLEVRAVSDLSAAVPVADIVSCVTLATEPLIHGA